MGGQSPALFDRWTRLNRACGHQRADRILRSSRVESDSVCSSLPSTLVAPLGSRLSSIVAMHLGIFRILLGFHGERRSHPGSPFFFFWLWLFRLMAMSEGIPARCQAPSRSDVSRGGLACTYYGSKQSPPLSLMKQSHGVFRLLRRCRSGFSPSCAHARSSFWDSSSRLRPTRARLAGVALDLAF